MSPLPPVSHPSLPLAPKLCPNFPGYGASLVLALLSGLSPPLSCMVPWCPHLCGPPLVSVSLSTATRGLTLGSNLPVPHAVLYSAPS